jgi:RNA recognition motif-containing protein
MNVPYDATTKELEDLVSTFVPVDMAVVPRDKGGLARGYAFVYLKNAQDVAKALEYVDGRHIRSRQIRAMSKANENKLDKVSAFSLTLIALIADKTLIDSDVILKLFIKLIIQTILSFLSEAFTLIVSSLFKISLLI